uniref:Uncharacterized protein n=1 Tax=Anguilla anguilla TaxID=7936 RepID=A0A0E9UHT3_ANGAN
MRTGADGPALIRFLQQL